MWQKAATQPFLIQTPLGPAYYNPADGSLYSAFIPGAVIFLQSAQQQQQQIPAAASIAPIAPAPPAPAASPIPPPPPPTFSAVNQSTFSPSPAVVEALEALSQNGGCEIKFFFNSKLLLSGRSKKTPNAKASSFIVSLSYWPVLAVHLVKHCTGNTACKSLNQCSQI
jgi:hypothetical protein